LEFEVFKKVTNKDWYDDSYTEVDEEHKITEFDYENYFNPLLLQNKELVKSNEFKQFVRMLNIFSETEYEKLQN